MIMVIPSRSLESCLLLVKEGQRYLVIPLEGIKKNSFEDALLLHPLVDQSEKRGKDPSNTLFSDL